MSPDKNRIKQQKWKFKNLYIFGNLNLSFKYSKIQRKKITWEN
jgi:hypothetical protein